MAAERIGDAWEAIWEAGVWATGVWAPVGGGGDGGGPAPSVTLTFRATPRLFGPRRVAISP